MKLQDTNYSLVMLHGFLGNHHDFDDIIQLLPNTLKERTFSVDLPGHNNQDTANFRETIHYIDNILERFNISSVVLYGYSLGGRIAINYAFNSKNKNIKGLILESSSFGITDEERKKRVGSDLMWASQFALKNPDEILKNWYQQPIFDGMTLEQKQKIIKQRRSQDFHKLAIQFDATSVARQENFRNRLNEINIPIHYIYGSKDLKYTLAAEREKLFSNFHPYIIEDAGHNIHSFFPQKIAEIIQNCEF